MLSWLDFLIVALGIQLVFFLPAYFFKTDKFTDFSYGTTFIVLATIAIWQVAFSPINKILFMMIFFWALRLVLYLTIRIAIIKTDERFDAIREDFLKFLSFWVLQGFSAWVIMLPAILFFLLEGHVLNWLTYLGIAIWLLGFCFESIADQQKFFFKLKPENKNKWIESGLWKWSRHPNYFGEITCWIGIYLFTFSSLDSNERAIGLLSPMLIIALLLFFTGIPTLEEEADKRWGKNRKYQEYKSKTNILIPMPRK